MTLILTIIYERIKVHALTYINGQTEITEKLSFGMLLALVGGFMDAYSYIVHGNVFATGQTGNFVLVAVRLAEKDYAGMFHAIIPIVSFWLGVFLAWHMFYYYFKQKNLLWKRGILVTAMIILFFTGLLPHSYPDIAANTLVSLAAALQYCAFRKFDEDDNYASIFCTGNMRSCADNYYKGFVRKDKKCLKKALRYSCIILAFFIGAVSGALSSNLFHERAIWAVTVILLLCLTLTFVSNKAILKNNAFIENPLKKAL